MSYRKILLAISLVILGFVVLTVFFSTGLLNPAQRSFSVVETSATTDTDLQLASDRRFNQQPNDPAEPTRPRIVLKNASLELIVADVTGTLNTLNQLATDVGGWVVNSNTSKGVSTTGDEITIANITIRVPVEQLDDILTRIKSGAQSVETETVAGQDVTQDYVDLTSQLTNLHAAEKQLQLIMDSADTTDAVLQTYTELVRVRGEIEVAQGRINYYDEAAAFSSITVWLRPPALAASSIKIGNWDPVASIRSAIGLLINILQLILNLLIFVVVVLLPLLLLIGLPGRFIYRQLRQRGWLAAPRTLNRAPQSASAPTPPEA
jgi:Domain of unknown function (DUF4349)